MDGSVVAFIGIVVAIIAYAGLTLWSWAATWAMRRPSLFVLDPDALPTSIRQRLSPRRTLTIAGYLRRQYSVKRASYKPVPKTTIVAVVRDCNAELSTGDNALTIDDDAIVALHKLIRAGLISNKAKAITTVFRCTVQSASRPDSVYQQVLKRLEALDGEMSTAAPVVTRQLRISAKSGVQYVPMDP